MGSIIEINDTLKLKRGDGFPYEVRVGERYPFVIPERRLYHLAPVRVLLVEEVDGFWNFIGHAHIIGFTIDALRNETRGIFEVTMIYPKEYVALANRYDAPKGKGLVL